MNGIPNPETVYDHTVSLVELVDELQHELGLSESETDDLKHILEVHDWSEAVVGDEFIPNEDSKSYEYNIPLFDEFDQYYIRDKSFSNPVLLQHIDTIREKLNAH